MVLQTLSSPEPKTLTGSAGKRLTDMTLASGLRQTGTALIRNSVVPQVLHFGSRYKGSANFRVCQGLIVMSLAGS
jgi:hypothetical protein